MAPIVSRSQVPRSPLVAIGPTENGGRQNTGHAEIPCIPGTSKPTATFPGRASPRLDGQVHEDVRWRRPPTSATSEPTWAEISTRHALRRATAPGDMQAGVGSTCRRFEQTKKKDLQVVRPVLSTCGPGGALPGRTPPQSASKPPALSVSPQHESFIKQMATLGMSPDCGHRKTLVPRTQGRLGQLPAVRMSHEVSYKPLQHLRFPGHGVCLHLSCKGGKKLL